MSENLTWALGHARDFTLALVADVPPEALHQQAAAGERHPAWLLGHLLLADTYLLHLMGEALAPEFQTLLRDYGPKSKPGTAPPSYSKQQLMDELSRTNSRRLARVASMSDADLARPLTDTFLARAQPTIGHHLYTLVFHEGYHDGQLSAWRKARGYAPVRWAFAPT